MLYFVLFLIHSGRPEPVSERQLDLSGLQRLDLSLTSFTRQVGLVICMGLGDQRSTSLDNDLIDILSLPE